MVCGGLFSGVCQCTHGVLCHGRSPDAVVHPVADGTHRTTDCTAGSGAWLVEHAGHDSTRPVGPTPGLLAVSGAAGLRQLFGRMAGRRSRRQSLRIWIPVCRDRATESSSSHFSGSTCRVGDLISSCDWNLGPAGSDWDVVSGMVAVWHPQVCTRHNSRGFGKCGWRCSEYGVGHHGRWLGNRNRPVNHLFTAGPASRFSPAQ